MRIWFDADNGPHVLVMKPLAEELTKRGHTVKFTARDRANTCELLDLYGFDYEKVGGPYGKSTIRKVVGTLKRAAQLRKAMKNWKADVSFGHGSRSLPIASKLLKVTSITMYDYEWVSPSIFNKFCKKILIPDAITKDRAIEAGIDLSKVEFYPGFKENLYLNNIQKDSKISEELNLKTDKIKVLLRPPATTAHYHNPEAEEILNALLKKLLNNPEVQLIWIPRTEDQNELVKGNHKAQVIIPTKVYPGPQLILAMDIIIGGGGTMTREAAILGIPSVSFFRGKRGAVDDKLEAMKRLKLVEKPEQVAEMSIERNRSTPQAMEPGEIVKAVADAILGYRASAELEKQ
jgi:predicted glycosyltransferase